MSTKRPNKSAPASARSNGNHSTKRSRSKLQVKKQISQRLESTESNSLSGVANKIILLQQPAPTGVLLHNSAKTPAKCSQQEFLVHQTEQEVFAQFDAECRLGRMLTPDEICHVARVIYEELLHEELKQLESEVDEETMLSAEFNACEEWFQDFCKRYNIPWRPHAENVASPENATTRLVPATKEVVIINLTEDDDDDDSIVEVPIDKVVEKPQRSVKINFNEKANKNTNEKEKLQENKESNEEKKPPQNKKSNEEEKPIVTKKFKEKEKPPAKRNSNEEAKPHANKKSNEEEKPIEKKKSNEKEKPPTNKKSNEEEKPSANKKSNEEQKPIVKKKSNEKEKPPGNKKFNEGEKPIVNKKSNEEEKTPANKKSNEEQKPIVKKKLNEKKNLLTHKKSREEEKPTAKKRSYEEEKPPAHKKFNEEEKPPAKKKSNEKEKPSTYKKPNEEEKPPPKKKSNEKEKPSTYKKPNEEEKHTAKKKSNEEEKRPANKKLNEEEKIIVKKNYNEKEKSTANKKPPIITMPLTIKKKSNKQLKQSASKSKSKRNSLGPISVECKLLARKFVSDFHRLIDACDYVPSQVFNAAQMFLKWKMVPQCTENFESDRLTVSDDRLSLLFCGNASGEFLVKPMFLHHTYAPEQQDETLLPIYVRKASGANRKDYNRAEHFLAWLQDCFIPEVRDFLQVMNLPAKALLLIDPDLLQGHTELPLVDEDNFVEFLYFPRGVTTLLQPLSMSVIPTFVCNYLQRLLKAMKSLFFSTGNGRCNLQNLWNEYPLSDALPLIQKSIEEINVACWNAGWVTLWKEVANEPFDPQLIVTAMRRIATIGRQIQKEAFITLSAEDVEKYLSSIASLWPAFRTFHNQKNHMNWRDCEYDSDIEDLSSVDLDKNPFLLCKGVEKSEEENGSEDCGDDGDEYEHEDDDIDDDDVDYDDINDDDVDDDDVDDVDADDDNDYDDEEFERKQINRNHKKRTELKSNVVAATSPATSRAPSLSDYEIPATPEFDISDCHSELSSPTLSECYMHDLDDDHSSIASDTSMKVAAFKNTKNRLINTVDDYGGIVKTAPARENGVRAIRSQRVKIERKSGRVIPIRPEKTITTMLDKHFDTVEDFLKFDETLIKHRKLQKRVIRYFRSQLSDDPTHDKTIQRIWRGILTDRAAYEFVWRGRRHNRREPVVNMMFSRLLRAYFLRKHKMDEMDFETTCSRTFEAFHDRQRRRLRRISLAIEEEETET